MKINDLMSKFFGGEIKEQEPLTSAEQQSDEDKALVAFVKEKLEDAKNNTHRIAQEGVWLTNAAYLLGFSGRFWDPGTRRFQSSSGGAFSRNRLQENIILPEVQTRGARLCQFPPKYDTKPVNNDPDNKDASRLGLEVLEDIHTRQNFQEKQYEIVFSGMQAGHCYAHVTFDKNLGDPIRDETGTVIGFQGEVRYDIKSAFQVYPVGPAKKFEDAAGFIMATVRELTYFRDQYPERGHLVKEEDAWLQGVQYEQRLNTMEKGQTGQTANQMKNCAIELIYYEKRSLRHPNGRLVASANGVLLADHELPVGEIPLAFFPDIIVPGRYNPEAFITQLKPIQDYHNLVLNRRSEWTRMQLVGKMKAPRGAGLDQEAMHNGTTEVVYYNPVPQADAPEVLPMPQIPAYAYKETEETKAAVRSMTGLSDVARGELPSASIPAQGMQILVEADQTRIGLTTKQLEMGYSRMGRLILKYVEKFYNDERMISISGETGEYMVKPFTGAMLKGNTNVFVVPGSTLPGSKVLQRQELVNMYNLGVMGIPGDPKTLSSLAEKLEQGEASKFYKKQSLNAHQLKDYLKLIEQGVMPPEDIRDDSVYIVQEMNDFRLEDKYKTFSPEAKEIFDLFMEFHFNAEMKKRGVMPTSPQSSQEIQTEQALSAPPMMGEEAKAPEMAV